MKNFKRTKIRYHTQRKSLSEKTLHRLATVLGVLCIVLLLYYSGVQLIEKISEVRLIQMIAGIFGKDLTTDSKGHTNVLLLGIGGEGHQGKDLTDTIIVASIDHEMEWVRFLSIPRDLQLNPPFGNSKINEIYALTKKETKDVLEKDGVPQQEAEEKGKEKGRAVLEETLEKVIAIPIHYVVTVDFEAFEEIVDTMDGIDVFVEHTINDPSYPDDKTYGYVTFYLPKGLQHLDGKTALKYVRSRKTTSDFDRSKRQQQVLVALKKKAAEENLFKKKRFLKELYYSLEDHVDTNLTIRELFSLASFAAQWKPEHLANATLNNESNLKGGFLYTPLQELYGGFVLLPAGNSFEHIRTFVQFSLYGPPDTEQSTIAILNGTKKAGWAGKVASGMNRFGIRISHVGNAPKKDRAHTVWYSSEGHTSQFLSFLQTLIPGEISALPASYAELPELSGTTFVLELGADAADAVKKIDL